MASGVLGFLIMAPFLLLSGASGRELHLQRSVLGLAAARTRHVGNAMECWNALSEIRACGKDIEAYFASGAIDITPSCCGSISTVVRGCMPELLTALGYTKDQVYILRGYCDATPSFSINLGPVLSPAAPPSWSGAGGSKPPAGMDSQD